MFRNHEGYYDPTAGLALSHIMREERLKRRKTPRAYLRDRTWIDDHRFSLQKELFDRNNMLMPFMDPTWMCFWPKEMDSNVLKAVKQEVAEKKMPSRVYTRNVKGEENPYQALASAIIIRAVKDYRNLILMMNRIKRRMRDDVNLTPAEYDYLAQRYDRYECLLDDAGDFFFSSLFSILCDLDGYDLLDRLNQEVMK